MQKTIQLSLRLQAAAVVGEEDIKLLIPGAKEAMGIPSDAVLKQMDNTEPVKAQEIRDGIQQRMPAVRATARLMAAEILLEGHNMVGAGEEMPSEILARMLEAEEEGMTPPSARAIVMEPEARLALVKSMITSGDVPLQYGWEPSREAVLACKSMRVLILAGHSDDLIETYGYVREEVGAGRYHVIADGSLLDADNEDHDDFEALGTVSGIHCSDSDAAEDAHGWSWVVVDVPCDHVPMVEGDEDYGSVLLLAL